MSEHVQDLTRLAGFIRRAEAFGPMFADPIYSAIAVLKLAERVVDLHAQLDPDDPELHVAIWKLGEVMGRPKP